MVLGSQNKQQSERLAQLTDFGGLGDEMCSQCTFQAWVGGQAKTQNWLWDAPGIGYLHKLPAGPAWGHLSPLLPSQCVSPSSAGDLHSCGEPTAPPGTHTVLTDDLNIVVDEADAIVQANFNEDLPKHRKGT